MHEQYNLPVCIYRPSTIIREGVDTTTAQAELDWVNALLHYIRKIGAAPKVEHNHGGLDLVRAESCCVDVIDNIVRGEPGEELRYVNQVGDVVIPIDGMHDMDADKGKRYELLSLSEWTEKAVAAGLHPGGGLLIKEMDARGKPGYPRLLKGGEIV